MGNNHHGATLQSLIDELLAGIEEVEETAQYHCYREILYVREVLQHIPQAARTKNNTTTASHWTRNHLNPFLLL